MQIKQAVKDVKIVLSFSGRIIGDLFSYVFQISIWELTNNTTSLNTCVHM